MLKWENNNDLDLSVIDPSDAPISYSTQVTEFGTLDHDLRVGPGEERITIHTHRAGNYQIIVNDYSNTGTPGFELTVVMDGETRKVYVGTLKDGRRTYKLEMNLKP